MSDKIVPIDTRVRFSRVKPATGNQASVHLIRNDWRMQRYRILHRVSRFGRQALQSLQESRTFYLAHRTLDNIVVLGYLAVLMISGSTGWGLDYWRARLNFGYGPKRPENDAPAFRGYDPAA